MRYENFYPFSQISPPSPLTFQKMGGIANLASTATNSTSKIEQYMQMADRVITLTQQLTPVIQQVQNIPALLGMYKGLSNLSSPAKTVNKHGTAPKIFTPK